jgi:hypothetical protein
MKRRVAWALAATLAAWPWTEARADAIDGNWCFDDGRRLTISGPTIVTPGGRQIAGNYNRHGFSYRVPDSEPSAGATVNMVLLDEYNVRVEVGGGTSQIWRRCAPATS